MSSFLFWGVWGFGNFFFISGNMGVFSLHDGMDIFPETKNQTTEMTMWGVAVNGQCLSMARLSPTSPVSDTG